MKKITGFLFVFFIVTITHAQYKVQFILKEQTAIHHDSIYITGTFSNWDSAANKKFLLHPTNASVKSIVLNLQAGELRYKFHRGSWLTVEKQYNGDEVNDRILKINKDTTFTDSVASWRDETLIDKKYLLTQQKPDTITVGVLASIAYNYAFFPEYYNGDSALHYAQKALDLQQKIKSSGDFKLLSQTNYSYQLINLQEIIASLFHSLSNYPKALEIRLENLALAEKLNDKSLMIFTMNNITSDYVAMKDFQHVLSYAKLMDSIVATQKVADDAFRYRQYLSKYTTAKAYYKLGNLDSALYYAKKMTTINLKDNWEGFNNGGWLLLADIYAAKGFNDSGFYYYRKVIPAFEKFSVIQLLGTVYNGMAVIFKKEGKLDSALFYARKSLDYIQNNKTQVQSWGENSDTYIAEITPLLAELYKANNQPDSAYKYLLLSVTLKDSLYNSDKVRQFQTLTFNESSRRQQLEQQSTEAQKEYETKIKMYGLISITAGVLIVAFILYRNNKHKQKANTLLQSQKEEIEKTLGELKTTQTQLIQSEKMASLGELTAGIAHEIQNPLNFVNNFSEVSTELIKEMMEEVDKGNAEEVKVIATDLVQNLEKINHHGKRAAAIVKGMLQHSRSSSAVKELTDINALCDEYIRLTYHGLRAKDKSFNATIKTEFDNSITKINIIPQDIGRVVLNLLTNAFYAVTEKKNLLSKDMLGFQNLTRLEQYEPTVSVSTSRSPLPWREPVPNFREAGGEVIIKVTDNGNGIPQKVLDKIFQPFFTTKPTGQGTGLGLSLSYDIITKGHGGQLKVETKVGEGTNFIIQLPNV